MTRALMMTGVFAVLLSLTGCNCDPSGGSYVCTRAVDGVTLCYGCPTATARSTCAEVGPSNAGCSTAPITCP